jgi:hypothetical protein
MKRKLPAKRVPASTIKRRWPDKVDSWLTMLYRLAKLAKVIQDLFC